MHKYAIGIRSSDDAPLVAFVYVCLDRDARQYVARAWTATGERGRFCADSSAAALDAVCAMIRRKGHTIVQGPILLARSRVRIIRWGGNTFMVSFDEGVLLVDEWLDRMCGCADAESLRAMLLAEPDVAPGGAHIALSADDTLVWNEAVLSELRAARAARERERIDDHIRARQGLPIQLGEEWDVADGDFWIPETR